MRVPAVPIEYPVLLSAAEHSSSRIDSSLASSSQRKRELAIRLGAPASNRNAGTDRLGFSKYTP